jgi:hypothetical protein
MEFLLANWAAIVPAAIVFFDVIANLTPSTKDNKISSALARLINALIPDKRK